MKFLHSLSAIGFTGGLAAYVILLSVGPEPTSMAEYAQLRGGIAAIATWLLLPSLAVVLVSGLLSMAVTRGFHSAGWAWLKAVMGVLVFEGTLRGVIGPAELSASLSERAAAGAETALSPAQLAALMQSEWGTVWVILFLSIANVVLAIWRPRLTRRPPRLREQAAAFAAGEPGSTPQRGKTAGAERPPPWTSGR